MALVKDISGTAFVVAEFRAEENKEETPLYNDWVVELFLSADSRYAAGLVAASFPPAKDLVRIRTKYFDETLDRHILSDVRQVVILGAGLDTRAVRKQSSRVTYFEIDDAATLELKRQRYEQYRVQADVAFISGNYVTDGLIELLTRNGFDVDLPTYVIWEGNTMYLPLEKMKQTLTTLRRHVTCFQISFDYMADSVISRTTGDQGITRLVESFAAMGAPWLTGIRDIRSLAHELNLDLIDNFETLELHHRYWSYRPVASPIFGFYSVCTLGT